MTSVPFLLAQNIKITNWLTPVWLISIGVAIGFILVLLMILKMVVFQRISGLNSVTEKPGRRIVVGVLTGLVYLALLIGFFYWRIGADAFDIGFGMPLFFAVPICMLMGFGVWNLISRRMIGETMGLFREGFLGWVNKVCIAMTAFAILGFVLAQFGGFGFIKFVENPLELMDSLRRMPHTGIFDKEFELNGTAENDPGTPIEVDFHGQEFRWITIQTTDRLEMAASPMDGELGAVSVVDIPSSRVEPMAMRQRIDGRGPIPLEQVENLYFRYTGKSDSVATVQIRWAVAPIYQEVSIIPGIAILVLMTYLFYMILATMCPKVYAIAHSTFKTEVNQPLFLLVMIVGAVFIFGSIYVPYNTFGEDIKMYKDSGLTLIRVLAIFLAIWAASKSVAEEIEGRTALTVLSKPVGRRQFIFGKFTGIAMAIGVMFIVLGLWFVIWTAYKPIYDYQEASKGICEWPICFMEAVHVIPGVFLCFLEVLIFVAISVAISTRCGVLANFLICFSVYVLGHLTPLLVQSSFAAFEPVVVFGQLVAIVFPVLNHFDVQAAINTNAPVPFVYIGWSIIYTGLYGSMAMLLALVLFEDRDLA